jgi:hypothetical protein
MLPSANSVLMNHENAPCFSAGCARTLTISPHREDLAHPLRDEVARVGDVGVEAAHRAHLQDEP